MQEYIKIHNHYINKSLYKFICDDLSNDTINFDESFWVTLSDILYSLEKTRISLIKERTFFQNEINNWHIKNKDKSFDREVYKSFLHKIGYLVPEREDFKIKTKNIDEEISTLAGPQLVVPLLNARYAINAANARWGSLYDALYGSDIISNKGKLKISNNYNHHRGAEVIKLTKSHLEKYFPLADYSYYDVKNVEIIDSKLNFFSSDSKVVKLVNEKQFEGYIGGKKSPDEIILKQNGLKIRLQIDKLDPIGKNDNFNLKDIKVESALSVIMDCEDSIVSVDAYDKVATFKNWLGLLDETIKVKISKNQKSFIRKLNNDLEYILPSGQINKLKGKSLMLIRNVGHLMTTSSILDKDKNEIGEGLVDSLLTSLCYLKTIKKSSNSKFKSLYVVKPKMHGPKEVKFSVDTFSVIENLLSIPKNTIKIGIMDEERRTTLNLKECIREAKERVFFINTGFLDRTGDEIHTSMEAGVMVKKTQMKNENWINAYEKWNVEIGLKCGFSQLAQIGKGMWAMPDMMSKMMNDKIIQCKAGASTAWVPSPTAATIHALHYHIINVFDAHKNLIANKTVSIDDLLDIPKVDNPNWTKEEIQLELDNNIQGILGYVVKWINNGIGCSKVPDINNIGLMEDRATLRISSQHVANWLYHNICNKNEVLETFKKMAFIVDDQNKYEKNYIPMSNNLDKSIAFETAKSLVFDGKKQPSGYTEPILHSQRLKFKCEFKIK